MTATATIDVTAFRRAIESRDATAQLAGYAADAELTIVDRDHPPSNPTVLRGAEQIGALLHDIAARDMTHQVTDLMAAPDRMSFVERCRYADGTAVLCATVATLRDGLITHQLAVQAWDS
ncbi:MAG: hypothetical protein QOI50_7353 [Pseudonocardiales bacterium]|jgi:hypothetical protein|nr:hypothetical protein [Pseudonocardiales bacterium]MDT7592082.1 hypothetical protein [Pseudonocardiales bacterium]MDT7625131.1 hypothetical protein [Pseudonocardiales bacterium]MDT7635423.1 hypothetical protein [Pseudonocardiales bacterium]MDT7685631.1 hypothetical protein [Pseudonocardiales bacterium]